MTDISDTSPTTILVHPASLDQGPSLEVDDYLAGLPLTA